MLGLVKHLAQSVRTLITCPCLTSLSKRLLLFLCFNPKVSITDVYGSLIFPDHKNTITFFPAVALATF